jgi:hypothetical protein
MDEIDRSPTIGGTRLALAILSGVREKASTDGQTIADTSKRIPSIGGDTSPQAGVVVVPGAASRNKYAAESLNPQSSTSFLSGRS